MGGIMREITTHRDQPAEPKLARQEALRYEPIDPSAELAAAVLEASRRPDLPVIDA